MALMIPDIPLVYGLPRQSLKVKLRDPHESKYRNKTRSAPRNLLAGMHARKIFLVLVIDLKVNQRMRP